MKIAKGTYDSRYLGTKGPLEQHQGKFRVNASSDEWNKGHGSTNRMWARVKK